MLKLLAIIYVNTIRRWISYWTNKNIYSNLTSAEKLDIINQMNYLRKNIKTTADIISELSNFHWTDDPMGGIWDYSPTIETFLYHKKFDDCDGSSFYTKWLFDILGGRECHIISLLSIKPFLSKSHVICIVKDLDGKYYIFSNGIRYKEMFNSIDEAFVYYKKANESDTFKYSNFYVEINY